MHTDNNRRKLNRENINKDILFRKDISCEEEKKKEIFDILSKTLEDIFDMFDFNVFVIDEDGIFRFVNEYYAAVAGKPKGEIIGKHVSILLPDSLKEKYQTGRDSLLKSKYGEKYKDTQAFISPDNTEHLFNTKKTLLPHGNNYYQSFSLGGKQLFFGTGIDVIDFEKAEKQLKKNIEGLLETNKNVNDSINYAKRIQTALLPNNELISCYFPDSFLIYRPKDIVSGDFYWTHKKGDETILAIGDCTGHGVSGAFLSILGINLLNNIVKERLTQTPHIILQELDRKIGENLQTINEINEDNIKQDESTFIPDGMDISVISINSKKKLLSFALANGIGYFIHQGKIEEIKKNEYGIGYDVMSGYINKTFTSNQIPIETGDIIYLLTDGFVDQFGGTIGKKFYRKNFKTLLEEICHLPINEQQKIIETTFETRKGERRQVDDVLIFATKLP